MPYLKTVVFGLLLFFIVIGLPGASAQSHFTVSGYVYEGGSQEALTGVNVYPIGQSTGTTTNTYGFYSLTLPARDSLTLVFSFVGYQSVTRTLALRADTRLSVSLTAGRTLAEVAVIGSAEGKTSQSTRLSRIEVPIAQLNKVPALLGEKDVLKVLQLMPGVQKGSEGNTGIYVRGGGPDQNLVILDDAVVYNPNHLLGFFSVFNSSALRNVELTKGGFPARYGGRLSSVIEVHMKEGNKEELHGEGSIGLIASRLTLEGPLKKGKSSFLVSGRRTYLDLAMRPFLEPNTTAGSLAQSNFYDLNAKINYDLGQKNKVYLSGYFGRDRFFSRREVNSQDLQAGVQWSNATGTLRWNHLFSDKLFANTSLIFSNYNLGVSNQEVSDELTGADQVYSLRYQSGIRDFSLKYDLDFYPSPRHQLRFGLQSIYHRFTPSAIQLEETGGSAVNEAVPFIRVLESGIYVEDLWQPSDRWKFNGGLRLSHFLLDKSQPSSAAAGGSDHPGYYLLPEPRLSAIYLFSPTFSLKASFAQMNQYVHMLSNTGLGLPADLWLPTTDRIKPQQSRQLAAGLVKDFDKSKLTVSVEGYYKTMDNIISYREGSSFLLTNSQGLTNRIRWEDNVTAGRGWSYGGELLIQRKAGRLSGWVGYTLSWTQWQFAELNFGEKFYPRYDRRHDISLVGIYELSPGITFSGTWVYGTGNALTIPTARFSAHENAPLTEPGRTISPLERLFGTGGNVRAYDQRNTFRAEPYHRLDLGVQFRRRKRTVERTWEISAYNAYNRRNPFYYSLEGKLEDVRQHSKTVLYRYTVFPIVPSVSYQLKF